MGGGTVETANKKYIFWGQGAGAFLFTVSCPVTGPDESFKKAQGLRFPDTRAFLQQVVRRGECGAVCGERGAESGECGEGIRQDERGGRRRGACAGEWATSSGVRAAHVPSCVRGRELWNMCPRGTLATFLKWLNAPVGGGPSPPPTGSKKIVP